MVGKNGYSPKELEETWEYFFSHYDVATIPVGAQLNWVWGALENNSPKTAVKILKQTQRFFPEVLDEALNTFLKLNQEVDQMEEFLALKIATPQELLVKLSALFRENRNLSNPMYYLNVILLLMQNGVNLFEIDPETSDPVIFSFALPINSTFIRESFSPFFSELFESFGDGQRQQVRMVKNSRGQTLLQHLQSQFIEVGSLTVWIPEWRCIYGNYTAWKKASLPEFSDWSGFYLSGSMFSSLDTFNPLLFEHNRAWVKRVQDVQNPKEVEQLLKDCPSVEVLKLMKHTLAEYSPGDKYCSMTVYLHHQYDTWCKALEEASLGESKEEVERLLKNIPIGLAETWFKSDIASLQDLVKKQIVANKEDW